MRTAQKPGQEERTEHGTALTQILSAQAHRRLALSRTASALVAILLLASFGLRIYRLGDKNVWWDEGLAVWAARQSLTASARWTAADVHPPLYFWMLHFWRLASGESEFGLRFLSVCFGVLTVVAAYRLGRLTGGYTTGVLAALLMGTSRFDVWWSQEMRMYVLAALLATFGTWSAIRFWDEQRLLDGVLYVLFTVVGLYTLYLYVSVLVVANLVWLWVWWRSERRTQTFLRWTGLQIAVLALFAPWLGYALGRIPTWSSASPVELGVFLKIYWTVLTSGISVSVEAYRWPTVSVLMVFVAGMAVLAWRARRDWRMGRNAVLLLLSLLLPAAIVYLVSLPREAFFYAPQLAPRYLLIFAPSFYVLMAWGIDLLGRVSWWPVGAVSATVALGVAGYGLWTYYPSRVPQDDYRSLTSTIRAYRRPDDAVLLYTDKDWPVFAYHHPTRWWGVPHAQPVTADYAAALLDPIWREHEGVWLVVTPYAAINDPRGQVPAWLSSNAVRIVEYRFVDKVLRLYARTEDRARSADDLAPGVSPAHPLDAELQPGLWAVGYDQPQNVYRPGDTIHLFAYWQRRAEGDGSYTALQARLMDGNGQTWKQVEVTPAQLVSGDSVRQQVDLVIPPDVLRGRYLVVLGSLAGGRQVSLGHVTIRHQGEAVLDAARLSIAQRVETDFGEGVRLLGYDIGKEVLKPGDRLRLTLYWQARQPIERRYKVFTHLLGEVFNARSSSFLWGQQDNEPAQNTRPTSTWRSGEVIVDSFDILVDSQAPAGRYVVEIGLYDPATGERLPVLDSRGQTVADHVVLTEVTIGDQ